MSRRLAPTLHVLALVLAAAAARAPEAAVVAQDAGDAPAASATTAAPAAPSGLRPVDARISTEIRALLSVPADDAAMPEDGWPLVLFLHGAGERGEDLDQVASWGPPRLIRAGRELPCIVLAPQCPRGLWWEPSSLLALLDQVIAEQPVDPDRVIVTGLSMGGYGTLDLVATAPERFAAAVPICGGLPKPLLLAPAVARVPLWLFHGTDDRIVPLSESVRVVEAVRAAGGTARLTAYEGVGHDSWRRAYADEELWRWMLEQRRGD
jgi:predicted peptidase